MRRALSLWLFSFSWWLFRAGPNGTCPLRLTLCFSFLFYFILFYFVIAGPIQGRLFGGESNKLFREVTCVQGRLSQKSTTYTLVSLHRVSAFTNVSLHKCQPHDFNPDLEEAVMVWIEIMPASSRVSHLPASHILPFPDGWHFIHLYLNVD